MPLTFVQCEKARPETREKFLPDGGGLYLSIFPSGTKSWCFRYRFQGKQKRLWLGAFPEVGIAHARALRDAAKTVLKDGLDPADVDLDADGPITFEAVGREWFENQRPGWSAGHAMRVKSRIEQDLFVPLGKRPAISITRKELLAALRAVENRGAIDTAKRINQYANQIFDFALGEEYVEVNPAVGLARNLKASPRVKHRASLNRESLPEFFGKLDKYEGQVTRIALKLIVHTFVRTSELIGTHRQELNFDQGVWRVPAERMKMKNEHIVPLTPTTKALFKELMELSEGDCLLDLSQNTMIYAMYRMGYHTKATVHGFRGTASTILNESGLWREDAIERQLAHVPANEVRAAYNAAKYLDERVHMMEWYSGFLDDCEREALEKNASLDALMSELIG